MEPSDGKLTAQDVDAQIAWLARYTQEGEPENNKNAQLVQHLQRYYQKEKQQQILERSWKSIAQMYDIEIPLFIDNAQNGHEQPRKERSGHNLMKQQIINISSSKRTFPRLGTLLAVAVLLLMVGTTAAIMSRIAQQNGGPASGGGHSPVCIPTPTPVLASPTVAPQSTSTPTPAKSTVTPTLVPCNSVPVPTQPPSNHPAPIPTQPPSNHPTPFPTQPPSK